MSALLVKVKLRGETRTIVAQVDIRGLFERAANDTQDVDDADVLECDVQSSQVNSRKRPTDNDSDDKSTPEATKQNYHKRKRAEKRQEMYNSMRHHPTERTLQETVDLAEPLQLEFSTCPLPVMGGGYIGANEKSNRPDAMKQYTVDELVNEHGFTDFWWDGIETIPVLDNDGRIFMLLAGRPMDPAYVKAATRAFELIMKEGALTEFEPKVCQNKRGDFPAFSVGSLYGIGHQVPKEKSNGKYTAMLQRIVANKDVRRLAAFMSSSVQLWSPRLFHHCDSRLTTMFEKLKPPGVKKLFPKSFFPTAAINFGGKVRTFKHRDTKNFAPGWCSVMALGSFDPDVSGKFIVWDLKLIIRFPHAATINIPSALFTHSNSPIQYVPGELLHWIDNGGCTDKELAKENPKKYAEMQEKKKTRWEEGRALWATFEEIRGIGRKGSQVSNCR
ncbi:hypothetical protein H0H93_012314 [Arthromyces matolae]|nr:hypothetical protein H0H93_012314 [Arthromyces matolae]